MATIVPTTGAIPPVPPMGALAILPTWAELFASLQQVFTNLTVNFAILLALLFTSTDGPESLLMRVEALVCHSPVILALEEPNGITLLKNPH